MSKYLEAEYYEYLFFFFTPLQDAIYFIVNPGDLDSDDAPESKFQYVSCIKNPPCNFPEMDKGPYLENITHCFRAMLTEQVQEMRTLISGMSSVFHGAGFNKIPVL